MCFLQWLEQSYIDVRRQTREVENPGKFCVRVEALQYNIQTNYKPGIINSDTGFIDWQIIPKNFSHQ